MEDVEISNKTLQRAPYFENLKIQNPNYNLVRNDTIKIVNRNDQLRSKSNTFIVNKSIINKGQEDVMDFQKADCNNENYPEIIVCEPKVEKRKSSSFHIDHVSQTPWDDSNAETSVNILETNITNQFASKNAETYNDDIIIFERSEYKCPNARIENVVTNAKSKSVQIYKLLNILGICFILLVVTGLFLHINVVHIFLNYLKIKRKPKPTNYEISLLFIKNLCQIIYSGVDTVRRVW